MTGQNGLRGEGEGEGPNGSTHQVCDLRERQRSGIKVHTCSIKSDSTQTGTSADSNAGGGGGARGASGSGSGSGSGGDVGTTRGRDIKGAGDRGPPDPTLAQQWGRGGGRVAPRAAGERSARPRWHGG